MVGKFTKNRKLVQNAMFNEGFITAMDSSTCTINETAGKSRLKEVVLNNIPFNKKSYCWLIDLENEKSSFAAPQGFKKVEKILCFFTESTLYFILVEMKSSIQSGMASASGLDYVLEKIKDSLTRISTLLPIFLFDSAFKSLSIKFITLVIYNENGVSKQIHNDQSLKNEDIIKIFLKQQKSMFLRTRFDKEENVQIIFIQNNDPLSPNRIEVDLKQLFEEHVANNDFDTSLSHTHICPLL